MKKIIQIIVVALFVVSMTFIGIGCKTTTTTTAAAATTTTAAATTTTAAAATTATEISVEGKTIGFSQVYAASAFAKAVQDLTEKEAKAKGMKFIAIDANLDAAKEIADVENFITQKVDVIIMIPFDLEASQVSAKNANKAKIPFIAFVNVGKPEEGVPLYSVNSDNLEIGKAQGEYFAKALPKDAKIVYMPLDPGQEHSIKRRDGFMAVIKEKRPDVVILAEQYSNSARDKGMSIMEDWLQMFPKIDAVITGNDDSAVGAYQAIKAAGLAGKIMVGGIDATQEVLDLMVTGDFTCSVLQPAKELGKAVVDLAVKLIKGEEAPVLTVVPPVAVSVDNIDQYIDYWKK
ncbi:MAG: sugar ABC transporter substrate-binding protein [Candidatus Humimicrobiaceae bacterium]